MHDELPAGDRVAQLVLESETGHGLRVHRGVEELPMRPAGCLGAEQRGVRVTQQGLWRRFRGRHGDTDRDGRYDPVALHLEVGCDGGGHPFCALFDIPCVIYVLEHDDEFVTAEASDAVALAHRHLYPVRDGGQHLVAGRVPQGVVHDFQVVHVDEQCPQRSAAAPRGA